MSERSEGSLHPSAPKNIQPNGKVSADGLVLARGFIELHTDYDGSVMWDGIHRSTFRARCFGPVSIRELLVVTVWIPSTQSMFRGPAQVRWENDACHKP
jgi:hypothetical protein